MDGLGLYRSIWRWHFYAGLVVMPLILILAVTGSIYLFKPQIERWEERAWQGLAADGAVSPDVQLQSALAAFPGAQFRSYRLPQLEGDAAMVELTLPVEKAKRQVFVAPSGEVLGSLDPQTRVESVVKHIHGQLLLGPRGSWIVELAASWAIVMLITGIYLWWPDGRGLAGVVWPRVRHGPRIFLRDIHAVTGFWVAGLALLLLLTGLPWTDVWGSGFKEVRSQMGWVKGQQDWTLGGLSPEANGEHAGHGDTTVNVSAMPKISLTNIVSKAEAENLAFPVLVKPPMAARQVGPKPDTAWTVLSDAPNRSLRATLKFDIATGKLLSREIFDEKHLIDKAVGYGIAWHEGALLGWVNQLIGLLTAMMLITLAITGFLMWRKRKPANRLGALTAPKAQKWAKLLPFILLLAAFLPLFAASLIAITLLDKLILPYVPKLARWMGMDRPT